MKKETTMAEMMGKGNMKKIHITMDNLHEFLGEEMPEHDYSRVGRVRLVRALKNRFGVGFRNVSGVKELLDHFDKEIMTEEIVKHNMKHRSMNGNNS